MASVMPHRRKSKPLWGFGWSSAGHLAPPHIASEGPLEVVFHDGRGREVDLVNGVVLLQAFQDSDSGLIIAVE